MQNTESTKLCQPPHETDKQALVSSPRGDRPRNMVGGRASSLNSKSMSLRARLPTPEQRVPDSRKRPVQAAWEGTRAPGFRTRGRAARRASAASASRCPWCPAWPAPSAPALQPARPPAAWLGSHRSPGPARQYLLESRKRTAERPGHAARPGQHRGGGGMEGGRPPDIGPGSSRK